MKRSHWGPGVSLCGIGFFLALFLLASTNGRADTKENPFGAISERNVFGLKPAPPPPDPSANVPPPVAAPPAVVELTGIISLFSSTKALLEIVPGPGKPMIKPPPMAVGERVESVELLAINIDKNEATIRNGSVTTNLTFKVIKSPPAAVAGVPGVPGAPQAGMPPVHVAAPQPQGGLSQYPASRNNVMVAGGAPAIPTAAPTGYGGQPNAAATGTGTPADNLRTIPSRNIRTTAPQAQPSLEEHYILTELNRNTHGLPLPPTPLNPNPQYPNYNPGGTPGTPQLPTFPRTFPPVPGGGNPQQE